MLGASGWRGHESIGGAIQSNGSISGPGLPEQCCMTAATLLGMRRWAPPLQQKDRQMF